MSSNRSGFTLDDAFERAATLHADRPAIHCGRGHWSFRELQARVHAVATALGERWLRPGDRLVVRSANCHRYLELYLACAELGAVIVPLDLRLAEDEVRAILAETEPSLLAADEPQGLEWLRNLGDGAVPSLLLSDDPPGDGHAVPYESLTSGSAPAVPHESPGPDAPIALFYTAAVAGKPRGAVLTHRNLVAQISMTGEPLEIGEQDAHGVFLPLSHTFGAYLMFVALCRGAANTILRSFDPSEAARLIAAGQVSFLAEFAPMASRILDAAESTGCVFPGGLRLVLGLDSAETIARYLSAGVQWWGFYGQTETAGLVTMGRLTEPTHTTFVGLPLPLAHLSLRNSDGDRVESGEAGEAWVRSDAVVHRYWPDQATRLTPDGWLRTGDVLREAPDHALWFIGRTTDKDLIKPGGLNVYPAEVELALQAHPAVARAFVFGVPDPVWRERVCAVVVPSASDTRVAPPDLAAFCGTKLASFKCPRADSILIVPEADLLDNTNREAVRAQFTPHLEKVTSGQADTAK